MMIHDDVQSTTFDELVLAELPRLMSMLAAWSVDRSVAEDFNQDALRLQHRNWCSDGTVTTHPQRARHTLAGLLSTDTEAQR